MENINIALHAISCLLALLAAALLLWVNKEDKHSNRLLAFILFVFATQNLVLLLLSSRLILLAPSLLRVLAPTTFLVGPLAYVYTRAILNDELRFKKYDWLLLIPALLALLNFIPYYLLPVQEKINYLNNNFYSQVIGQDPGRGILPGVVYYIARICWSGIFLVLCYRLIFRFKHGNIRAVVAGNRKLLNWLFTFCTLLTAILIVLILKLFVPTLKNTHFTIADTLLAATTLFTCLQLFVRPQILYGIFKPLPANTGVPDIIAGLQAAPEQPLLENDTTDSDSAPALALSITAEEQLRYKTIIEQYFKEHKPYLQTDYSLNQLVLDTHLARHIVSAFINREYGMGFREYINRFRVDYFKSNLDSPQWSKLTLEAIAQECGFSNRITFITNFKKITGQTPSGYMKAHIS